MVKDPHLVLLQRCEQLGHSLCSMEARRSDLVKHFSKLADTLALLVLPDLRLDNALRDGASDLHEHVGEAFDPSRVL